MCSVLLGCQYPQKKARKYVFIYLYMYIHTHTCLHLNIFLSIHTKISTCSVFPQGSFLLSLSMFIISFSIQWDICQYLQYIWPVLHGATAPHSHTLFTLLGLCRLAPCARPPCCVNAPVTTVTGCYPSCTWIPSPCSGSESCDRPLLSLSIGEGLTYFLISDTSPHCCPLPTAWMPSYRSGFDTPQWAILLHP